MTEFRFDVFELDQETLELVRVGERRFARGDWSAIERFVKLDGDGKPVEVPISSSGLRLRGAARRSCCEGCLGYSVSKGNDVYHSFQNVVLLSAAFSDRGTRQFPLCPDNFRNAVAYFSARHLSPTRWLYTDDEFHVPDEQAPGYPEWRDSALVYAAFHSKNQCTSLRDLEGPVPRFHNHMFWLTYEQAGELFDHEDTVEVYDDWVNFPAQSLLGDTVTRDPHFATLIPQLELMPEAKKCLELAMELLERSRALRSEYYDQFHLRSWDAGWYQLKDFWKNCYRKQFDALKKAWYALRDKLAPGVFDFGWLKR